MKIVTITDAKNKLSALIDQVRAGESILIVDRGRPVARLESAISVPDDTDGRLSRLQRSGTVRVGRKPPGGALKGKPPRPRRGRSISEALLEERRTGR